MNFTQRIVSWARSAQLPLPNSSDSFQVRLPGQVDLQPAKTDLDKLNAFAGWVYAAAETIMTDVGAAEFGLWEKVGLSVEDWRRVEPVPPELLRPNSMMGLGLMMKTTQLHLDLAGKAYWHKIREEGQVKADGFEIIYPHWVDQPIVRQGKLEAWKIVVPGSAPKDIPAEDIVFLRYPHPTDPLDGFAPINGFILSHELDLHTRGYGAALMKNNAVPALVLGSDQDIGDKDADIIASRWQDRYENRPGLPGVVGRGIKVQLLGLTLDKLGLDVIDKMTRDQVFGAYGVPASKRGLVEDVNRANGDAAERTYQKNVLKPRLTGLSTGVNEDILESLGIDPARYHFGFVNPVDDDQDFLLEKTEKMVKSAMITVGQGVAMLGEEPNPDQDVYLVPTTMHRVPAGSLATLPEPDAKDSRGADNFLDDPALQLTEARFVHRHEQLERVMRSQIRGIFSEEQRNVVKALLENWDQLRAERGLASEQKVKWIERWLKASVEGSLEELPDWETRDAIDQALDETLPRWQAMLHNNAVAGAQAGWSLASNQIKNAVDFSKIQQGAINRARRWSVMKINGISRTTERAVRKTILYGIRDGHSVDQIATSLRTQFDQFKGARASTIARTETLGNINYGSFDTARKTMEATGKILEKIWVTNLDGNERDTHRHAHKQRRDIAKLFDIGGAALRFPGDAGAAKETINCRCTVNYQNKKRRKNDPPI